MIAVEGLSYAYEGAKSIAFDNFHVGDGEHLLLLGDSGSGKTTLLHLIGGLLRSQSGRILINGTELSGLRDSELDRFRGQHIGFVFQRNHLISSLTVEKNLLLAPFLAGVRPEAKKLADVAGQLGIADKLNVNVKKLSQGQAQRVAIARAVLNRPAVILADEPTSALDDKNCERVIDLLHDVSRKCNADLVVATHDQRLASRFEKKYLLRS